MKDIKPVNRAHTSPSRRVTAIALGHGTLAGFVAGGTLLLMTSLQEWIWSLSGARWYVFAMVCLGGLLLAPLRHYGAEANLDEQIAEAGIPSKLRRKKTALLALSAIIAVGFGGAIGPEAGLLAVVAELSVFVSARITRTQAEEKLVGQAGNAAALAAVYGSPPAGASYEDDSLTPSKLPGFVAGVGGFLAFLVTLRIFGHAHDVTLPVPPKGQLETAFLAIPSALLACALAVGYTWLRDLLGRCATFAGPVWLQTAAGTVLLASLLCAWPLLRFSGHAELPAIADYADESAWWTLVALAVLKAVATALSLASGWHGGEFFPLAFAGASAGAVAVAFVPGLDVGTALVAGMTAASTIAIDRPLVVLFIVVFIVPGTAVGPLVVATLLGAASVRFASKNPESHH